MNPNYTKIWLVLAFTLVMLSFYGCVSPTKVAENDSHVIEKEWNDLDKEQADKENVQENTGPTNFQGIADILGCMFAPHTCTK